MGSITGLFEPPPYPTLFGLLSRSAAIAMSTGVSVGLVQQTINIYQELIRLHPVKTKSLSSGVIGCIGSCLSQLIKDGSISSLRSPLSFLVFGTAITLYRGLDSLYPGPGILSRVLRVLTDRLVFSPVFLLVTIYTLARLQGRSHQQAVEELKAKYVVSLLANWKN